MTLALVATLTGLSGCLATTHDVRGGTSLGRPSSAATLEATMDQPGPVSLEVVKGADWAVPRSGLINLDHPAAKAAGLKDGDEPIKIFTYVLRHPTKGTFLVDTGVAEIVARDPKAAGIGMLVRSYLKPDTLKVGESTDHVVARLG
ncbi:MAG TPA: MBL fold metallo-hydrolase, partial [Polyangia bacterium]|nr:MBL fold metallo-hydrolase [Polyangia bacterium]